MNFPNTLFEAFPIVFRYGEIMILKRIFLLLGWFNEAGPGDSRNAGGQINEAILVAASVDSGRQLARNSLL